MDENQNESEHGSLSLLNDEDHLPLPTSFFEDNNNFGNECIVFGGKDGYLHKMCMEDDQRDLDYGIVQSGIIFCMAFTPDFRYIFTGGNNGVLKQYSLNFDSNIVWDYTPAHKYWIRSMIVSPDGKY